MQRLLAAALLMALGLSVVQAQPRPATLGAGYYASELSYSRAGGDRSFSGVALYGSYAPSPHLALRGGYSASEDDRYRGFRARGLELALLAGVNLREQGLKGYAGVGFFRERWRGDHGTGGRFAGHQLLLGVGHNWERLALDVWLAARAADDYAGWLQEQGASGGRVAVNAGGLLLALRF